MSELADMIRRNMVAMGEEEKEACIHCGTEWYRIHYRDGVCHQCQQLSRPGRTELAARRRTFRRTLAFGALVIGSLILRMALR